MKFYVTVLAIIVFTSFGCMRDSSVSDVAASKPVATPTPVPRPAEKIDSELERAIAGIAQAAYGKVGVGAVLLETGEAAYLDRGGHFAMQSVYKLPIAMAAAQQVDKGKVHIDSDIVITPADYVRRGFHSPIRNLNPRGTVMRFDDILRYSLSESDGSANDVLLNVAGGPPAVQQYLASIGISDIMVSDSTKDISRDWDTQYRNWATPEASVDLLRNLIERQAGLSERTTTLIFDSMLEAETGRHRIHHSLPPGATLAHKTGTGGHPSEVPGYWKTVAAANANNPASKAIPKNQKPAVKRSKSGPSAGDDPEEAEPKANEVISAVNDIGIINLPDGRHILLAVYINDSVSVNPDKVIADIAKAVCDKWTTGQLPNVNAYQARQR
jgi:beta-lactamase class A